jgi:hypothetical protein
VSGEKVIFGEPTGSYANVFSRYMRISGGVIYSIRHGKNAENVLST